MNRDKFFGVSAMASAGDSPTKREPKKATIFDLVNSMHSKVPWSELDLSVQEILTVSTAKIIAKQICYNYQNLGKDLKWVQLLSELADFLEPEKFYFAASGILDVRVRFSKMAQIDFSRDELLIECIELEHFLSDEKAEEYSEDLPEEEIRWLKSKWGPYIESLKTRGGTS